MTRKGNGATRPEPGRDRGERYRVPEGVRHTGGGAFDPTEENVYFIASSKDRMNSGVPYHDHLLIAVNDLEASTALDAVEEWLALGKKVFIDSGVFHLSTQHARAHGMSMDEALALAPDQVDGFADLLARYVAIIRRFGDRVWGYIEIDQGGRENKLKTRAMLENEYGLSPIPVYHPFNDGWDYFDYLAQRYDRICFGNVVMANKPTRQRLLATAWERHRRYPYLWIHLLGLTPNQALNALPINSGDSSTWCSPVRWPTWPVKVMGARFGDLPLGFRSPVGVDTLDPEVGSGRAVGVSAYQNCLDMRVWRRLLSDWEALGCDLYPMPAPGEEPRRGSVQ